MLRSIVLLSETEFFINRDDPPPHAEESTTSCGQPTPTQPDKDCVMEDGQDDYEAKEDSEQEDDEEGGHARSFQGPAALPQYPSQLCDIQALLCHSASRQHRVIKCYLVEGKGKRSGDVGGWWSERRAPPWICSPSISTSSRLSDGDAIAIAAYTSSDEFHRLIGCGIHPVGWSRTCNVCPCQDCQDTRPEEADPVLPDTLASSLA